MEAILNDIELFIPKTSTKILKVNTNYSFLSDCQKDIFLILLTPKVRTSCVFIVFESILLISCDIYGGGENWGLREKAVDYGGRI